MQQAENLKTLHFTILLHMFIYLQTSPLSSSDVDMAKYWETSSFMHQCRYVHDITRSEDSKSCYKDKQQLMKPTEFLVAKPTDSVFFTESCQ